MLFEFAEESVEFMTILNLSIEWVATEPCSGPALTGVLELHAGKGILPVRPLPNAAQEISAGRRDVTPRCLFESEVTSMCNILFNLIFFYSVQRNFD